MKPQKLKLKSAEIKKFKSIETDQRFNIEPDITILVGMNESGKTSVLEALAKTNYFQKDPEFEFNATHDYPRREKKSMEKSGDDPVAIICEYELSDFFLKEIENDLGAGVVKFNTFSIIYKYKGGRSISGISVDKPTFISHKLSNFKPDSKTLKQKLTEVCDQKSYKEVLEDYSAEEYISKINEFEEYLANTSEGWTENPLGEYIWRNFLSAAIPKFLYYDEYYSLPSRISIEALRENTLQGSEYKTAKALFELADINIDELLAASDFEDYKAELEATEATITDELFRYWSSNKNLEIEFEIDKKEATDRSGNRRIVEHILDIRVKNSRARVSLPLRNRSKGFNWFFSFLVWFKKVQEDKQNSYILLLDEPGLNLHASAQADLLKFIADLSGGYQIVYTTHSPFMVESKSLHRVRTVYESEKGTIISDSLQEKDPRTLFPLQAALGYDIAQNLFISPKNLLVEGVSDMLYLQAMSELAIERGGAGLSDDITIVPVGGLEKVVTFISLLRGSNLAVACLMDSVDNQKVKSGIEKMIIERIIHKNRILYYDQFIDQTEIADIEDLFEVDEYVSIFNKSFVGRYDQLENSKIPHNDPRIVKRIAKAISEDRFNHFRPASVFCRDTKLMTGISKKTTERFSSVFKTINKLFA